MSINPLECKFVEVWQQDVVSGLPAKSERATLRSQQIQPSLGRIRGIRFPLSSCRTIVPIFFLLFSQVLRLYATPWVMTVFYVQLLAWLAPFTFSFLLCLAAHIERIIYSQA